MIRCLMHEQSHVSRTCGRAELGVWAGLVSRDGSSVACGWNGSRTVGLLLAGETFADPGAESGCVKNGQEGLQGLLALYEKCGFRFLERLNGWFSGILLDLHNQQTTLFNDRYGLGRVYCHQSTEAFSFSSEAKSLLKVLPQTRRLDERGLAEWLTCGCVLQNRTLFSDVFLLPPGSAWTFSPDGKLTKRRYFEPKAWESQPVLSASAYYERLEEVFPKVLKRYLNGKDSVAMSLTGGLDGRMIMAWSPLGPGELPCYTFNGPLRECADVKIARKVARACRQPHQTIPVGDQFFAEFPALAEKTVYLTDGAMDATGAVELYVNRLARQIAPVRLTGNYGSEILRGNVAFKPHELNGEIFSPDLLQQTRAAARTYSEEAAGNRLSFIAFKQMPWHHFARFAAEQSQLQVRSPFLDNDLVALAFQRSPEAAMSLEPSLRLIAEGNPQLGRIPTDRGLTCPAGRAANRVNRCVKEFLAKAEYAYDYGMPNWLARIDKSLAPLRLQRLFLGRQKFCHFRSWYRHELAEDVKQILLDPPSRTRPWVKGCALEAMVTAHVRGTRNYTLELHKLVALELIQRKLLS